MALTCPQCAATLQEVKAEATTGYLLLLDQCPTCGGIWCDKWEALPLTSTAAARIDAVDADAVHAPVVRQPAALRCPRCRARMHPFRDPALPVDAQIERCLNCEGMWFNRGALRRFKQHAAPASPAPVRDADIERLARAACDPQSWPTVGHLDDAMRARPASDEDTGGGLMSATAWLIVRAALRLLLGR